MSETKGAEDLLCRALAALRCGRCDTQGYSLSVVWARTCECGKRAVIAEIEAATRRQAEKQRTQ